MRLVARARSVSVLLLLSAITGCSTLARGPNQTVSLKTDAPDATVYVGKLTLHAPCEFRLTRKQTYTVLITAPGRQSVQFDLVPHFDGMSLGNLIYPGGSLGVLTDFLTGADKKFTPVKTVHLPVLDPKLPTLVLLRQHKDRLMTRQELDALKQGGVAASTGGRPEMAVGG